MPLPPATPIWLAKTHIQTIARLVMALRNDASHEEDWRALPCNNQTNIEFMKPSGKDETMFLDKFLRAQVETAVVHIAPAYLLLAHSVVSAVVVSKIPACSKS